MSRSRNEQRASGKEFPALRLRELTLAGFGVYDKPTRFLFPEGNAIYFGPNETGKSTLLFGLAATWFGLPTTSDASRVGTARFRSFGASGAFFGEVVWERDGRLYRLRRDFETHKVHLTEESSGQIEILFQGEHNPMGRSSAGSAFPPVLCELLGFASWDVFLQTFCLSQPLPRGDQLDGELQHLLSGSQDARIDEVRERLFTRIKELTRNTGEMGLARPGGIRPTNQRDPGKIEVLESRAAKIRLQVEHARLQLERLNQGNDAIEEAQAEQQRVQERREQRRRRCATLESWTERQQERMRRSSAVQLLRKAAAAISETAEEESALRAKLSRERAGLDAPCDAEPQLEELERAAREQARSAEAEAKSAAERKELEAEQRELEERLQEYASVRGRTDLAETHASLARAVAKRAELERELEEMQARRAAAAALPMAEPMSVDACRVRAMHYLDAVSRLETIEVRSEEIRAQLEERRYLQENGRRELLTEKFRLESELKECSAALREGRAREEADEATAASARPEPASAIRGRANSHAPWIGALGGCAVVAGITLGLGFSIALSLLVAAGAGALLFVLLRGRLAGPLEHSASSRPDAGAGATTHGETAPGVAAAAAATGAGAAASAAPADRQAAAGKPSGGLDRPSLTQLRLTQRKLEDRLQELSIELGPYAQATSSEISRMEGRWQALDDEAAAIASELQTLRPRLAIPAETRGDWRDGAFPPEMAPLLELPDAPDARSHRELIAWLRALDEIAWERFFEEERARRESEREWTSLDDRIETRTRELADRSEIEILEKRLRPFTLEDDPELLTRRAEEASRLERQLDLLRDRLAQSESPATSQSFAELLRSWNELLRIWPGAAGQAPRVPGDPSVSRIAARPRSESEQAESYSQASDSTAARQAIELAEWAHATRKRLREIQPLSARIEALAESQAKLLASENCSSRVELEERLAAEEAALGAVVRELDLLSRGEPLLSGAEDADPESRARRLDALLERERADEESDRALEQSLETEIRELHRKQASLEGAATPNVASLEIELRGLEDEIDESKRERDALATAYQWMDQALEAYQRSHRAHLAEQITGHFRDLTGIPRRVSLDERFEISLLDPAGHPMRIDQLSQGARDQLLLAIRFGVADLLSSSIPIPFFFDDPFVHLDRPRLELVRTALERLGRRRPWVLLTHRAELAEWAEPIFVETAGPVASPIAIPAGGD